MTIFTRTELQQKLGRTVSETDAHIDKLNLVVTNADAIVKHITQTVFESTVYTNEYIDQYGLSENRFKMSPCLTQIWFPAPIITLTSVYEDTTLLVENTDYYVYKTIGRIDTDGTFNSDRRGVKLTATVGYASVPADIKECALLIGVALSGLSVSQYMDENGDPIEIIKSNVPSWVWKHLKSRRWVYV